MCTLLYGVVLCIWFRWPLQCVFSIIYVEGKSLLFFLSYVQKVGVRVLPARPVSYAYAVTDWQHVMNSHSRKYSYSGCHFQSGIVKCWHLTFNIQVLTQPNPVQPLTFRTPPNPCCSTSQWMWSDESADFSNTPQRYLQQLSSRVDTEIHNTHTCIYQLEQCSTIRRGWWSSLRVFDRHFYVRRLELPFTGDRLSRLSVVQSTAWRDYAFSVERTLL